MGDIIYPISVETPVMLLRKCEKLGICERGHLPFLREMSYLSDSSMRQRRMSGPEREQYA